MGKRGSRKTRSDKKRDVKPVIALHLKDTIYNLSHILEAPVKDVAETLCIHGVQSKEIIDQLSINFKRSARLSNTIYFGDVENESLQRRTDKSTHERITIKFKQEDFEDMALLAYALDVTPSRAVALLLAVSITNSDTLYTLLNEHANHIMSKVDKVKFSEVLSMTTN